jgi:hypothetical protein
VWFYWQFFVNIHSKISYFFKWGNSKRGNYRKRSSGLSFYKLKFCDGKGVRLEIPLRRENSLMRETTASWERRFIYGWVKVVCCQDVVPATWRVQTMDQMTCLVFVIPVRKPLHKDNLLIYSVSFLWPLWFIGIYNVNYYCLYPSSGLLGEYPK